MSESKKAKLKIGLEQQGHIPLIEEKLKRWLPLHSDENPFYIWREIAKEIGWIDYAVCQSYISHLQRKSETQQKELEQLRGRLAALESGCHTSALEKELKALRAENEALKEKGQSLIKFAWRQVCAHEETHRGGEIWEICDHCGMKWADDEGGKPEYKDPAEIIEFENLLTPPEGGE